ncbi:MAG: GNAT family N-acetyltransferase [Gemmatimonadota bacterium]|nr:GNAT family N-acetyltransferase [Gemmatimonadota bacterium]MDH3479892.1 GNAT family N-acetyltransferase [Gemmatimonadota bacterium]MDH3570224.1 GNAT family N-acetyltransferase [Gemmatimonadota bacterium]
MTVPKDRLAAKASDAVSQVSGLLDDAARADASDAHGYRIDRELIDGLQESLTSDAVLAQVDLGRLAALLERCTKRVAAGDTPAEQHRRLVWDVLDLLRRPAVVRRIDRSDVAAWADRMLAAVEASHYTVGHLFRHRAKTYASKVLFELPGRGGRSLTWRDVATRVDAVARGLIALEGESPVAPVAILSDNRLEMALTDLVCLTSGFPDVMVPASSTETDVGYILRHAKVRTVVVSGREQLHKVQHNREQLPDLLRVISFDPIDERDVLSFARVEKLATKTSPDDLARRREQVRIDDFATAMYTSGTTGTPKGIQFSQRNLVFKRFARGLALPGIGDTDVFLCYLPLFHTFGRYLEMLGSVFWGAKYCFLLDPSVEALVDGMRTYRPSVFISVPRKWIQLYEVIAQRADPLEAPDDELRDATREVTGGRLRWGLSAAGHLDPEIFKFFQNQGVELHSGFGMSEATGGITMTPAGEYSDNSLGPALPGIEMKVADDGELMIRGPYVMMGYLDPPDGSLSFDAEGWFHTGDLVDMDAQGHIRLVDRKKEIYKNIKGQTIAPQRIENLFREFESVGRAFLVGDHKPYNTLLIHPNPNYKELNFSSMAADDVRDHFRSLIVSVNKFVAPFERIVDFAIIDRDLDADKGELTPKGTPRRKAVVENFSEVIAALYHRTRFQVGGVELTLPNWLFQTLGLTAQDVRVRDDHIALPSIGTGMTVRRIDEGLVRIGAATYGVPRATLDLGAFLTTPQLWLGNEDLVAFAPLDLQARERYSRGEQRMTWRSRAEPYEPSDADREALPESIRRSEWDLRDLDRAGRMLAASDDASALDAVRLLERVLANEEGPLAEPARALLSRAAGSSFSEVRRRAFQMLVPTERPARMVETLERFFERDPHILDSETSGFLGERTLPEPTVAAFIRVAEQACSPEDGHADGVDLARSLLSFLAEYGAAHPARYSRTRAFLVRMSLFAATPEVRRHAADARVTLEFGFRQWLGPTTKIAVDTETGQEYRWEDVVVFEEGTDDEHRRRILSAIRNTPFLREGLFLFYRGTVIKLNDVPPGGVWIRLLGERHGKAVYRITVQTRTQESFDLAVNLNLSISGDALQEEMDWLVLCGDDDVGPPVVERFGGYLAEQDLWSEEYVPGDTLDREMRRLARRTNAEEGLAQLWPFLAWNALSAYVDFWRRTRGTQEIAELDPGDVVLPTHDYHTGTRIVSLSARRPHAGLPAMLRGFKEKFVDPVEREYAELQGTVGWDVVFASMLEVLGEQGGLAAYRHALDHTTDVPAEFRAALVAYVSTVEATGFLPMRLYFAAKRYRRWARLNESATNPARAATLQELYDTYGLDRLSKSYPEVRLRFFRDTVFRESATDLVQGLDELIRSIRAGDTSIEDLASAVADLRQRYRVEPDDDYFLARIPFGYLRPEDSVDFISMDLGGGAQSEIVVTLEDSDANLFRVRHALLPKEVERLHRIFVGAKLDVRFRPEHRYLVAINEREQIIGGIFYEVIEDGETGHLEKIVVTDRYRRKGVADGLMREFFNRLRAAGAKRVTTGFFRPEYFYSYGFTIERRYAGLVKSLEEEKK